MVAAGACDCPVVHSDRLFIHIFYRLRVLNGYSWGQGMKLRTAGPMPFVVKCKFSSCLNETRRKSSSNIQGIGHAQIKKRLSFVFRT